LCGFVEHYSYCQTYMFSEWREEVSFHYATAAANKAPLNATYIRDKKNRKSHRGRPSNEWKFSEILSKIQRTKGAVVSRQIIGEDLEARHHQDPCCLVVTLVTV
jgi:hypothetical protein